MSNDTCKLDSMVNWDTYPITDQSDPKTSAIIKGAHRDIESRGVAELKSFLNPRGLELLLQNAIDLLPRTRANAGAGSVYTEGYADSSLPVDHPRRTRVAEKLGVIAYDQFDQQSPIRHIYESEAFMRFVGAIFQQDPIYRYADALGALNITVTCEGEEKQWHFDKADFGVSLALQAADRGGEFEVVPWIRSPEEENYNEVKKVLEGDRTHVQKFPTQPGGLLFFRGRYSLHRVAPVYGATPRLVVIFAYDGEARTVSSEFLRETRYGKFKG